MKIQKKKKKKKRFGRGDCRGEGGGQAECERKSEVFVKI